MSVKHGVAALHTKMFHIAHYFTERNTCVCTTVRVALRRANRRNFANLIIARPGSYIEQVKPPIKAYHRYMKRELPVTRCTECGGAGYNSRVANARCCKIIDKQRCNGTNAAATKISEWTECTQCDATGYYRNKDCPNCAGSGYLFVRPKDEVAV